MKIKEWYEEQSTKTKFWLPLVLGIAIGGGGFEVATLMGLLGV